jgi:hypothetical protein
MARPRPYEIEDTPLTWALRTIRRRLRLRQAAFEILLLNHPYTGLISRWESGQLVPSIENLLRLLKLAETPQERTPIVDALKARGIDELLADLQPYLSAIGGDLPSSSTDRIAPVGEDCNV